MTNTYLEISHTQARGAENNEFNAAAAVSRKLTLMEFLQVAYISTIRPSFWLNTRVFKMFIVTDTHT